ncbi:hypothetical protein MMC22_004612 [Lobaria immixta]|nr:hypothetical protein [Lobaria immixta]
MYERLVQNEQESLEEKFTASRALFMILQGFMFVAMSPAFLINCLGTLLRWPVLLAISPILLLRAQLLNFAWNPLFGAFVPAIYFRWNNRVYQDLQQDSRQIRVLELSRGSLSANVEARLTIVDLDREPDETHYEALSYSWGGHLMLRRLINLNGHSYLVADTVFNALRELRLPDRDRRLWIDAICVNQGNLAEKSQQVGLMGSIYETAQNVIVWLGKAPIQQKSVFDFVHKVAAAEPSQIDSVCANVDTWQSPLQELMRARWWSRVWIVQEVVLARHAIVRNGQYEVEWETLAKCFRSLSNLPNHRLDDRVLGFVDTVAKLKHSHRDPANGLLDFAISFRDRDAGNPRDKLVGFCGLLQSNRPEIPEVPYKRTVPDLFAHFAGSWIEKRGSLALMALAENRAIDDRSWAVDWTKMTTHKWKEDNPADRPYDQGPLPFWNDRLLPSISACTKREYSAAPNQRATRICKEGEGGGPSWRSLYLTGWQEDVVARYGDQFGPVFHVAKVIRSWERLAGGPWTDVADSRRLKFIRTLVADTCHENFPLNWPEQYQQWLVNKTSQKPIENVTPLHCEGDVEAQHPSSESDPGLFDYVYACCLKRRFFITKRGRFGLGPSRPITDGRVCVLFGSSVPFILMQRGSGFRFIGQAYVDEIMDYKGNLQDDLKTGKITTQEFLIK